MALIIASAAAYAHGAKLHVLVEAHLVALDRDAGVCLIVVHVQFELDRLAGDRRLLRANLKLSRIVLQIFVREGNRHAALAARPSDAPHPTLPHAAAGEHTGNTRFEEIGIPAMRPASRLDDVVT